MPISSELPVVSGRCGGGVVIIWGPVGTGKTTLLNSYAEHASRQGGRFIRTAASASERPYAFTVLHELIRRLRREGMSDPAASCAPHDLPALMARFTRAVCDFAAERPLVLAVDDVHFADEQSMRCLTYLARRIEQAPVLLVLSVNSGFGTELPALYAETLHLDYCHRIALGVLSPAAVGERVAARVGAARAAEIAAECADLTGGNPLVLNALLEDLTRQGRLEPGPAFRQAVLRCLHRVEPGTLAVARAVAILGAAAGPARVAELLRADPTSTGNAMVELREVGLLTGAWFRRPEMRLAVLADIPVDERQRMHSRAAELLHGSGAPASVVADQLVATGELPGSPWRVAILREASREACAASDLAAAADYLRLAVGYCADERERARVEAELAHAKWHLDPVAASRHLPGLIQDVRAGRLSGCSAVLIVRQLLWWGEFATVEELLSIAEEAGEAEERGGDRTLWHDSPSAVLAARLWFSLLRPGGSRSDLSDPTSVLSLLHTLVTAALAEASPAEHVFGPSLSSPLFDLLALARGGHFEESRVSVERELSRARTRRVPVRRAIFELAGALLAWLRGDVATTGRGVDAAFEAVPPPAWGVAVGLPLALGARAALARDDRKASAAYLTVPVPSPMFETPLALPYLQALGHHHLANGRPEAALTQFEACGDLMVEWNLDLPGMLDWRNDAVTALIALRQHSQARMLLESHLTTELPDRSRGLALRLLASITTEERARLPLLEKAVDLLKSGGAGAEAAAARRDLAELREILRTPDSVSELEVRWDADRAPGAARLTDAERRVAALAAAGATNREIAGQLCVTVSTVEQHLTKIYRKLNVRRRSALAAWLQSDS